MKAGRELDALVAEKVMGDVRLIEPVVVGVPGHERSLFWKAGSMLMENPPEYSQSIEYAWQVVEKLKERSDLFPQVGWVRVHDNQYQHRCEIWMNDPEAHKHGWLADIYADTAPLAICLAALKAVGVEVDSPK